MRYPARQDEDAHRQREQCDGKKAQPGYSSAKRNLISTAEMIPLVHGAAYGTHIGNRRNTFTRFATAHLLHAASAEAAAEEFRASILRLAGDRNQIPKAPREPLRWPLGGPRTVVLPATARRTA